MLLNHWYPCLESYESITFIISTYYVEDLHRRALLFHISNNLWKQKICYSPRNLKDVKSQLSTESGPCVFECMHRTASGPQGFVFPSNYWVSRKERRAGSWVSVPSTSVTPVVLKHMWDIFSTLFMPNVYPHLFPFKLEPHSPFTE